MALMSCCKAPFLALWLKSVAVQATALASPDAHNNSLCTKPAYRPYRAAAQQAPLPALLPPVPGLLPTSTRCRALLQSRILGTRA